MAVINMSNYAILKEGKYYQCGPFILFKVFFKSAAHRLWFATLKMLPFCFFFYMHIYTHIYIYIPTWILPESLTSAPLLKWKFPLRAFGQELWLIKKELKQRSQCVLSKFSPERVTESEQEPPAHPAVSHRFIIWSVRKFSRDTVMQEHDRSALHFEVEWHYQ